MSKCIININLTFIQETQDKYLIFSPQKKHLNEYFLQYSYKFIIVKIMMTQESDEDNWQPTKNGANQFSMFKKIQAVFSDEQVNQNLQKMLSEPCLNNDDDLDPEDRPKQVLKIQALYDPLQDDQNQSWIVKNKASVYKKPLICPNCFTQVAYSYNKLPQNEYLVPHPINITVLQTKVIRNRQTSETIDINQYSDPGQALIDRQQQFNVKIVCTCQCGVDIGYYDVNKAAYVLIGVI